VDRMMKQIPMKSISFFMAMTMLFLLLPLQAFADTSDDNRLGAVGFSSSVELNTTFKPDTYFYTATVKTSDSTITLTPYALDSAVNITVNGTQVMNGTPSLPITLQTGGNIITVETQSLKNPSSVRTYVFSIQRISETNVILKNLTIEGANLNQSFSPETLEYAGHVKPSQSYVIVKPIAQDYASIRVNGSMLGSNGYTLVGLSSGVNTITVLVTSYNGATKTYTVQLNRPLSSDVADLSSVVIGGKTYTESGVSYIGYVAGNATSVNVVINARDTASTIDINGQTVTSGATVNLYLKQEPSAQFTVTVTASNGSTRKKYTLYIIRQTSSDSSINGSNGSGSSSGGLITNLSVDSNGTLNIEDGKGSTAVLSKSGASRTYTVTLNTEIKKALSNNTNSKLLVIDYSKMTTINDAVTLNIDSDLAQFLQSKKIPVKLKSLNGYVTADLTKLKNWDSGGYISISRNNIGVNFGSEYTPATGFINISYSGSASINESPFEIEIPVYSDGDMKLANVYQYDGSKFHVVFSTTSGNAKKVSGVLAGDYIVMNYKKNFTDIKNHWSYNLVDFMAQKHYVTGYPNDTFQPDRYVTRAEFTAMLVHAIWDMQLTSNALDEPFTDVAITDWFYPEVNDCWKYDLVQGITDSKFEPNRKITREQMAAIAVRTLKKLEKANPVTTTEATGILGKFLDANDVSPWARVELATAIKSKILDGVGHNNLASQENATRAQAAAIVYKVIKQSSGF